MALDAGVSNGSSAGTFWGEIFNGHRSEISHNTIVGARDGLYLRSGWSVRRAPQPRRPNGRKLRRRAGDRAVDFVQPDNDVTGMIADEDYLLVPEGEVDGLFVDEETYVRDRTDATYADCGSRVTAGGAPPPPLPDGGVPPGSPDDGQPPAAGDGGVAQPDGGTAPAPSGCGCRAASGGAPSTFCLLAALALLRLRRRARGV